MYVPRPFAVAEQDQIAAFVDAVGAAQLVTFDGSQPVATLIPVLWDRDDPAEGTSGRLLGHLALANPQWKSVPEAGAPALAIVQGPQAYISPSWYPSKAEHGRAVPTWNYVVAQLTGTLTVHRDTQWLRQVVTRLTEQHERPRVVPWAVTDAPGDYIDRMLGAIVGVELTVTSVEASDKLSQNRDAADRAGVVAGLREEPGAGPGEIAARMAGLSGD